MISLEQIQERKDFLTQARLRDSLRLELPWIKRDFLLRPWSNAVLNLKSQIGVNRKALMTSNSDFGLGVPQYRAFQGIYGASTKLIATNVMDTVLRKFPETVFPAPIGLTDYVKGSPNHELFSDVEIIKQAFESQYSKQKMPVVSVTFSPKTHYSRRLALRAAKLSPFCYVSEMEFTCEGRRSALSRGAQSLGVLCPRGNGLDTHRLWETLYTGSIPVVRTGDFSRHLLSHSGLPYLEIRSWDELSNPSIIERLEEIAEGFPNIDFSALGQEYWRGKILKFIN